MGFSHNELFQDKEYIETIHMVMDLKGIVPVVGTVLYNVNTRECTMEEKCYSAASSLLSMLTEFGDLKRLAFTGIFGENVMKCSLVGFKSTGKDGKGKMLLLFEFVYSIKKVLYPKDIGQKQRCIASCGMWGRGK